VLFAFSKDTDKDERMLVLLLVEKLQRRMHMIYVGHNFSTVFPPAQPILETYTTSSTCLVCTL
jgi:hypothetical protein